MSEDQVSKYKMAQATIARMSSEGLSRRTAWTLFRQGITTREKAAEFRAEFCWMTGIGTVAEAEIRRWLSLPEPPPKQPTPLAALRARVLSLLRQIEYDGYDGACPQCDVRPFEGHRSDCSLAQLLRECES